MPRNDENGFSRYFIKVLDSRCLLRGDKLLMPSFLSHIGQMLSHTMVFDVVQKPCGMKREFRNKKWLFVTHDGNIVESKNQTNSFCIREVLYASKFPQVPLCQPALNFNCNSIHLQFWAQIIFCDARRKKKGHFSKCCCMKTARDTLLIFADHVTTTSESHQEAYWTLCDRYLLPQYPTKFKYCNFH